MLLNGEQYILTSVFSIRPVQEKANLQLCLATLSSNSLWLVTVQIAINSIKKSYLTLLAKPFSGWMVINTFWYLLLVLDLCRTRPICSCALLHCSRILYGLCSMYCFHSVKISYLTLLAKAFSGWMVVNTLISIVSIRSVQDKANLQLCLATPFYNSLCLYSIYCFIALKYPIWRFLAKTFSGWMVVNTFWYLLLVLDLCRTKLTRSCALLHCFYNSLWLV
jgi:hypothetical protein